MHLSRGTRPAATQTRHGGPGAPVCSSHHRPLHLGALVCQSKLDDTPRVNHLPVPQPPIFSLPCGGGSSGCLGGKLVIAQDAAQRLADLRMQRLCVCARNAISKEKPLRREGVVGTHWLGRPLLRTLDLRVACLLRASRGAWPGWVGHPQQKKKMGVAKAQALAKWC